MRVIANAWHSRQLPHGTIATIGNFDGVHKGQQEILKRVVARAGETGLPSVVVTFDPHPLKVLRPEQAPKQLSTLRQKTRILEQTSVDAMVIVSFTPEFSKTSARQFVEEFLHQRLGAREVFVGIRFAFGKERVGNLDLLSQVGEELGFRVVGLEEVSHTGKPISSTRIRQVVEEGRMQEAQALLARPYAVRGCVVKGEGRGKDLGWPTINIEPENEILPADGVYVSLVSLSERSDALGSVTNIGRRPTFAGGSDRVVESHIFDFDRDLYGQEVELQFLRRLRDERTFPSGKELAAQIARDVRSAREYLARDECLIERATADD